MTWIKSNKRVKEYIGKDNLMAEIKLIGYLQKQSKSLPNSNVKIYKKKWFWFDNESGVLYYTLQQPIINNNNSTTTTTTTTTCNNSKIKSIVISQATIIEQSRAFRLDFNIINEKVDKHYVLRSNDEQSVLNWVSGLNNWKKFKQEQIEREQQQLAELAQQKQLEEEQLQSRLLLEKLQQQQQPQDLPITNEEEVEVEEEEEESVEISNIIPFSEFLNNNNNNNNNNNIKNQVTHNLLSNSTSSTIASSDSLSSQSSLSTTPTSNSLKSSQNNDILSNQTTPTTTTTTTTTNNNSYYNLNENNIFSPSTRTTQHDLQLFLKSLLKNDVDLEKVPTKVNELFFRYPTLLYQEQICFIQDKLNSQLDYLESCLKEISYLNSPLTSSISTSTSSNSNGNGNGTVKYSIKERTFSESPKPKKSIKDVSGMSTSAGNTMRSTSTPIINPTVETNLPTGSLTASLDQLLVDRYIDDSGAEDEEETEDGDDNGEDEFQVLPNHLSLYIFSYLEPVELLVCARVSKQWQLLSEDNLLWVRFVFHLMTPSSIYDTSHKWKQVYMNHYCPKQKKQAKQQSYMNRSIQCSRTSTNVSMTLMSFVVKEGWLFKRGEDLLKIWKKRYFVLKHDSLFYFKSPNDNIPCGMILFNSRTTITRAANSSRKHSFKIVQPKLLTSHVGVERKRLPYYLSADKEQDCQDWMNILLKIIKSNSNPKSTSQQSSKYATKQNYKQLLQKSQSLFNIPQPQISNNSPLKNNIQSNNNNNNNNNNNLGSPTLGYRKDLNLVLPVSNIFGIPITTLMENQKSLYGSTLEIPFILDKCFSHIIEYGLLEEGIFRLSGSVREITLLTEEFESMPLDINLKSYDIHTVTSLVKTFFRRLPNSLITLDLDEYATAVQMAQSQTEEERISEFKFIFESMDTISYQIFKSFLNLLRLIIKHEQVNKMTVENLLIVIMPNLKCSPILITNGIKYYDQLFK
ncbi:pleckstrin (PH) domain-containing protein [Tieghemostelium lacteum]|uniref:Pleckstrin (PH) domain-containing protein n=1 Tax=Tieghemostelium lacteum TaxID=361077 RepID=A0A151Z4P6_TIELA|nr:pleckstrin (PH) domain-containing protein [Tieghemostelium lacteum]|eukprot:KYQ88942.1 pleckstrin (PH) domain-containing protein [Tieghemostelium lacteum]